MMFNTFSKTCSPSVWLLWRNVYARPQFIFNAIGSCFNLFIVSFSPKSFSLTERHNILKMSILSKVIYRFKAAAAAAKSLQSCPTLCKPIDGSPPGFPSPGILQARTLEWVANIQTRHFCRMQSSCGWLLSRSTMLLRAILVGACISRLFLLMLSRIPSPGHRTICLPIYQLIHWGCFQGWTITNVAAIHICVDTC